MKLFKITIYDFGGSYYNRLMIDDGYDKIQECFEWPHLLITNHTSIECKVKPNTSWSKGNYKCKLTCNKSRNQNIFCANILRR